MRGFFAGASDVVPPGAVRLAPPTGASEKRTFAAPSTDGTVADLPLANGSLRSA